MELRQLEYFLEVAQTGSVTSAAKNLHIAQPSLSQAVHRLERELRTPLFERLGRGMRLTVAGQALLKPAQRMVRERDDARTAVNAVLGLEGGYLDVVSLPSLAVDPVARVVGEFCRLYPSVKVRIAKTTQPEEIVEFVDGGRVDAGVTHLPLPAASALVIHELGAQRLLLVFPPGTKAGCSPVGTDEMAGLTYVCGPPGGSSRVILERALLPTGKPPSMAVETESTEAVVPLVLAGAGAALLPEVLARAAEAQGAVICETAPSISRPMGVIHRPGLSSPAATAFMALALCRSSGRCC